MHRCLSISNYVAISNIFSKHVPVVFYSSRISRDNLRHLSPYVHPTHSYAFGRSNNHLINTTVGEELKLTATKDGSKVALESPFENIKKTYEEVNSDAEKLATALHKRLNICRGDTVGLWSCNVYSYIQVKYAVAKIGAILCTLNPVYKAPELEYALKKAKIKALFMPGKNSMQEHINDYNNIINSSMLKDIFNGEGHMKSVIALDGSPQTSVGKTPIHLLSDLTKHNEAFDDAICSKVQSDDPAYILFTSGTTGKPKGATLSHSTIVNNSYFTGSKLGVHETSTICVPLPLFHSFALVLGGISMSVVPTKIVLTGLRFDVKSVIEALIMCNCTHLLGTPTLIIDILDYIEKQNIELPHLKGVMMGGAPVPVEVALRVTRLIPSATDVRVGYGATETGPCSTASEQKDTQHVKIETVGSPIDFVEVKIVDHLSGELLRHGEQGELLTRGHHIMIGYWDEEAKTKEVITESKWYKTGDVAVMDNQGYSKIVGRTKELIIRGGENIYPREIEELLHTHENILDVYAIGVPDERVGEEVCVWIRLKDPTKQMTLDDVKAFCKEKISYFKIPKHILIVDDFPLTATGKAKKFIMTEISMEKLGLRV